MIKELTNLEEIQNLVKKSTDIIDNTIKELF
jgi:hypothetical protein